MIKAIISDAKHIPVIFICRHFGVNRSGYYHWLNRKNVLSFVRKEKICKAIKKSYYLSGKTYGSPRVYDDLKEWGYQVSENTVAKYMQELGLDARLKKAFRVQTTDSKHDSPIASRLFKVEDSQSLPKQVGEVLAGDITYLKLGNSFLYLAVVIDIFTREVVGWSMKRSLHTDLVLDALDAAMAKTNSDAKIIFHSDRGSQYASEAYRKFCQNRGILPSMSRKGNCYDNSYVESWFSSLKKEKIYRSNYTTEKELKALVFEYIEVWYNRKRKHSALDYLSPVQFKQANVAVR